MKANYKLPTPELIKRKRVVYYPGFFTTLKNEKEQTGWRLKIMAIKNKLFPKQINWFQTFSVN
jgi:hypothetical protein